MGAPTLIEQDLARIAMAAGRTYQTLEMLGDRNRRQGFLGEADLRQWERAQRRWTQFEREARISLIAAEAHETAVLGRAGSMPPGAHARMVFRAGERVTSATEREEAFARLRATFGPPPAPPPFPPMPGPAPGAPGPGGMTPMGVDAQLARVSTTAQRTYTTLQDLAVKNRRDGFLGEADMKQWERASQQWRRLTTDADTRVRVALAHQAQLRAARGMTPPTEAEARAETLAQERVDRARERRGAMRWLDTTATTPPPTPGPEERGPGMFARGLQRAQGMARQARDIALGLSVVQILHDAMSLYTQRAHGIISVGMAMGQSFQYTGDQINKLRAGPLHMMAQDIIAAQQAYGRIAGTTATLQPTLEFGLAHGIDAAKTGAMGAMAERMTSGPRPLTTMLGAFRQDTGGRRDTMAVDPLMDELMGMAGRGAETGVRMPGAFYGRMAAMFTNQNPELMQVPGALQRTFGQFVEGMGAAPNDVVYAMKQRAIGKLAEERAARGESSVVGELGGVPVDIATNFGRRLAIEQAGFLPVVGQSFVNQAKAMSGGRPDLEQTINAEMTFGGRLSLLNAEQQRRGMRQTPGGLIGMDKDAPLARATQQQADAAAIARRNADPNFTSLDMKRAAREQGMEASGAPLVRASLNMQEAVGNLAKSFEDGSFSMKKFGEALASIEGRTLGLAGVLQMLSATSTPGFAIGAAMVAGGVLMSTDFRAGATQTLGPPVQGPSLGGGRFHLMDVFSHPMSMGP
jgi:hypothetical protein